MASAQCQKPSHHDQTNHHHTTTHHDQTACHNNNNNYDDQHSFGKKVKEMAHSVGKMFHHNQDTGPKPTNHHGDHVKTDQNKMKKTHHQAGHEGHCMPKMRDRIRNMKTKKKMHTKEKYSDSDSSSSDSDNENSKRKH